MITQLFAALKAGQELKNPAQWKRGQQLTNLVGALITGLVMLLKYKYPDAPIPPGLQETVVEIVCAVLIVVNMYLTPASSKKIAASGKVSVFHGR